MTDVKTGKRLAVSGDGRSSAYLVIPWEQVQAVTGVLARCQIPHWVDNARVSVNGGPTLAVVNIRKGYSVDQVQSVLDREQ